MFKKKANLKNLKSAVLEALKSVQDEARGADIVSLGMVTDIQISDDLKVVFLIEVEPKRGPLLESLRQQAEYEVSNIPGIKQATGILTAQKPPEISKSKNDPHGMDKNPKLDLPIKHIIAVASGKGGVGKSTISSNLASALAKNNMLKIGLLDADIYGPSQPRMMGLEGQKPKQEHDKIIPLMAHGVRVMSIGFMIDSARALIWRGPMVQTAIYQLLRDVAWGTPEEPLDILIVDMPPGTGDAQLTMAQKVPLSGAIIVSTPQDIALLDARKAIEMFRKTNVPILGIIENMSTHICSNCGHEEHIFGHGGARKEAQNLGVPFLGEIPLDIEIRKNSDAGRAENKGDAFQKISLEVLKDLKF